MRAGLPTTRLASMTLLKNIVLWDGSPPRSAGVPNLFGVSPQRDQFADQNAPNELGSPTENAFFNRILDTSLVSIRLRLLNTSRSYSAGAGFVPPRLFEKIRQR